MIAPIVLILWGSSVGYCLIEISPSPSTAVDGQSTVHIPLGEKPELLLRVSQTPPFVLALNASRCAEDGSRALPQIPWVVTSLFQAETLDAVSTEATARDSSVSVDLSELFVGLYDLVLLVSAAQDEQPSERVQFRLHLGQVGNATTDFLSLVQPQRQFRFHRSAISQEALRRTYRIQYNDKPVTVLGRHSASSDAAVRECLALRKLAVLDASCRRYFPQYLALLRIVEDDVFKFICYFTPPPADSKPLAELDWPSLTPHIQRSVLADALAAIECAASAGLSHRRISTTNLQLSQSRGSVQLHVTEWFDSASSALEIWAQPPPTPLDDLQLLSHALGAALDDASLRRLTNAMAAPLRPPNIALGARALRRLVVDDDKPASDEHEACVAETWLSASADEHASFDDERADLSWVQANSEALTLMAAGVELLSVRGTAVVVSCALEQRRALYSRAWCAAAVEERDVAVYVSERERLGAIEVGAVVLAVLDAVHSNAASLTLSVTNDRTRQELAQLLSIAPRVTVLALDSVTDSEAAVSLVLGPSSRIDAVRAGSELTLLDLGGSDAVGINEQRLIAHGFGGGVVYLGSTAAHKLRQLFIAFVDVPMAAPCESHDADAAVQAKILWPWDGMVVDVHRTIDATVSFNAAAVRLSAILVLLAAAGSFELPDVVALPSLGGLRVLGGFGVPRGGHVQPLGMPTAEAQLDGSGAGWQALAANSSFELALIVLQDNVEVQHEFWRSCNSWRCLDAGTLHAARSHVRFRTSQA